MSVSIPASEAEPPVKPSNAVYAHPLIEERFARPAGNGAREAYLLIDGIRCGACALNVERGLQQLAGILEAEVNFSTHRARVVWDRRRLGLDGILDAIRDVGYSARPYDPSRRESGLEQERELQLRRLGLAALFGMQVMAISLALYVGNFSGMQDPLRVLLRWASLVLVIPVITYSALPFFSNAVGDLRRGRAGMDVPVTLGLLIAFFGSAYATVAGRGEIYFDSVVMFVFLLLLVRFVEFTARARHTRVAESLVTAPPAMATRLSSDGRKRVSVPAAMLASGDRVVVASGETVPADGILVAGESTVDESLLTGESRPVSKAVGDELIAGSVNFESPMEIRVTRAADDTLLASTLRLMERARTAKPPAVRMADRIAARFVAAVLLLAVAVAVYWWQTAPDRWLAITISVLVITCPCALSLATPAALTAGISVLTRRGLIVTRSDALETLARVSRFVFDKTGTLTAGILNVNRVEIHAELSVETALQIAAGLEQNIIHPIARSIRARATGAPAEAQNQKVTPGRGVEGVIDGRTYLLGSPNFIRERIADDQRLETPDTRRQETMIWLASENRVLASIVLEDELRSDAPQVVSQLRSMDVKLAILSGDSAATTAELGQRFGIDDARGGLKPQDKLAAIRAMQARGERVALVGDGINDAPVLAGADVSFAMAGGPEAARASADLILIQDRLVNVAASLGIARRTRAVIAQNLAWALGYNLIAVPAAVAGMVQPWLAAVGMSLSSLIVVANSLRAGRDSANAGRE